MTVVGERRRLPVVSGPAWPAAVWRAPVLRGLDDAGRAAITAAGRLADHAVAATIYREGADGDALFVVIEGAVELRAVRRGDEAASVVRIVRAGESFGEEAYLAGLSRRSTAIAIESARVAEVPVAVLRRALARTSSDDREQRYLERAAARDVLTCAAFARELPPDDLDVLLDAARLVRFSRGTRVYDENREDAYIVVDGLVQLLGDDDRSVVAYLARGDFFGDNGRAHAAVAAGDTWCAAVSIATWRSLGDRHPGLLPRLRRVAEAQAAAQRELVGEAEARSTRHVFRDLYRMQMARSLLVIDQDSCVRCGHCAWSCEDVHGVSRLVRRGDHVRLGRTARQRVDNIVSGPATLLLPNTCQHCRNAACMIDCPTGAIARDPDGEVFIRASLCTGCGNCAKACPWENIQLAVVAGKDVAVKCDLCHGYDAPACVSACPTGAVMRLDPQRDVAEVARILGLSAHLTAPRSPLAAPRSELAAPGSQNIAKPPSPQGLATRDRIGLRPGLARGPHVSAETPESPSGLVGASMAGGSSVARSLVGSAIGSVAIVAVAAAAAAHRALAWSPARGIGYLAGVVAAVLALALAAYVIPKRFMRPRKRAKADRLLGDDRPLPRSRTKRHLAIHLAVGALLPAAVLAHAGPRPTALSLAMLATLALGALAALAYRLLPRALTRLERRGTLPEDLAGEADTLAARLYRAVSGKGDREKALVDHVLLPYARARLGGLALVASGRDLSGEERRMHARVDAIVKGRRLDVGELIRIAVEIRALPARRVVERMLRGLPALHVVAAAMALALLFIHVVMA